MENKEPVTGTDSQDAGEVSASQKTDYEDAVSIGAELERQVADLGRTVTPLGYELIFANMIIACFYPAVWCIVVLFYVTGIAAAVNRTSTRNALKRHDIAAAKAAIADAKKWTLGFNLVQAVMAIVEFWAFIQMVNYFKGS